MGHTDVVDAIVAAVAPFLGDTMAQAATHDQCRKLGLGEGELTGEQVDALLTRIGKGLNLFVGRDQSSELVGQLRRQLLAGGGVA